MPMSRELKLHSFVAKDRLDSSTPTTMAAAAAHATALPHLKLVVDTHARRVLFAEASGEAIEFLHSVLVSPHVSLPFDGATGNACIANVYDSVEKLREFAAAANNSSGPPPCSVHPQEQQDEQRFFVCGGGGASSSCGGYVADKRGATCPSCGGEMAVEVPRGCPGASCSDAYAELRAKGPDLTCMVMDDLNLNFAMPAGGVIPMAWNLVSSCVAPGTLQEKVVCLSYTEAMEILETSLQSSTVLTDVFLRNKKTRPFGKSPQ